MSSRPTVRPKTRTSVKNEADNKENTKMDGTKAKGKAPLRAANRHPDLYCTCKKPDDGSPMIRCESCRQWYHFRCIQLDERDAEDLHVYICDACHQKTGLRTTMEWEGTEGPEQAYDDLARDHPAAKEDAEDETEGPSSDPDDDDGSGDEYVEEQALAKVAGSRRVRRVSFSSDTDSSSGRSTKTPKRVHRTATDLPHTLGGSTTTRKSKSASPGPAAPAPKRKQAGSAHPPAKRIRSESGDDPTRKYCLTKLQEVFCQIFRRYPFLSLDEPATAILEPSKKEEELTDEEKEKLESDAKQYATELEQCIYDMYAEPDKSGKRIAAGKYKERFRMLTFNLSKPDRVLLHKRIAASHIRAAELSTMSSTDLADEETKQSIKQAEQEALAHSILKKQVLPRTKITHKGIENIEDASGAASRDAERVREDEEEERMERERQARLKLQAERARSASLQQGSMPPESPVVAQSPGGWGAPPPLPMHAMHADAMSMGMGRPPPNPLFVPSASDYAGPVENELNLADLINLDEDISTDLGAPTPTPVTDGTPSAAPLSTEPVSAPLPVTPSTSTTGPSPFATKQDYTPRLSFDLSSLWTPKGDSEAETEPKSHTEHADVPPTEQPEPAPAVDIMVEEANDQDFDMFLGKDEDQSAPSQPVDDSPEAQRAKFEALPKVWAGTLSMPLDSAVAQDVSLNARQTGGRTLGEDSPLWQTLFPTKELRIDGRVPVDKSAQYLTQMRLNPTKELIAATFSPEPGTGIESLGFQAIVDHLVAKGRHGLVFPWGNRPKEFAPGRELYIIPLLSNEAIPEYMELLDNLRLPKLRNRNLLVGIWVLNKGKLAPPPPGAVAPPAMAPPAGFNLVLPTQHPTMPPQPAPMSIPQQPGAAGAALASEVAALTPEQIQLMLRTLQSSTLMSALPQVPQVPPYPQQPLAPAIPPHIPPIPPIPGQQPIPVQPWLAPSASYPPPYQNTLLYPSGSSPPPPPPSASMPEGMYSRDGPRYPSGPRFDGNRDRGGPRGGRGGGPRGRGRARGGQDGRDFERSRDAGWKGRGRGGASSPPRGRGWN